VALGEYGCGIGSAGHDPVLGPPSPNGKQTGAAFIDPNTRDAVRLSDGTYQATHSVDQAAALAIMIAFGTIGSVPQQGETFRQMEHRGRDLASQVDTRARAALSALILRGDIAYLGTQVEPVGSGFNAQIAYRNLRISSRADSDSLRTLTAPV
jgi:hypothetical protein